MGSRVAQFDQGNHEKEDIQVKIIAVILINLVVRFWKVSKLTKAEGHQDGNVHDAHDSWCQDWP